MSDFDREAERERLREQFEADKQKREQSERMSELLLKGATMTNKHCDRCGDPVFRWNGQEFCPTCQGQPGGEAAQATPAEPDGVEGEPVDDGKSEADTREGTAHDHDQEFAGGADAATQRGDATGERVPDQRATEGTSAEPQRRGSESRDRHPTGSGERDDVAAARASLARTLASLSEQAETASDLATTRKYLAGAKEAAEALDAAERAGR